jgi:uncharacterized protein (DUF488 family)
MHSDVMLFTIGHSTHPIEQFIALLKKHAIAEVVDVRSMPYSRFQPQFSKEPLAMALKGAGIDYLFLGKELGARSDDKSTYEKGRVQYRRLAKTELFQGGIAQVLQEGRTQRIALMCAEREPLECHRTLLVTRELIAAGGRVSHILGDGQLETHAESMRRLQQKLHLPEQELFRSPDELLDEAYAKQEERIAYVDEHHAAEKKGHAA